MYRGIFTVGITVIRTIGSNNALVSANAIGDYSYVDARNNTYGAGQIARCVTGLGPGNYENNNDLGEFYFNGNSVSFSTCHWSSPIVQPRGAGNLDTSVGVINIGQCRAFITNAEGIYTCTMINSSMVEQSVRFGVYFTGRSE